jgi:hypothetical protein
MANVRIVMACPQRSPAGVCGRQPSQSCAHDKLPFSIDTYAFGWNGWVYWGSRLGDECSCERDRRHSPYRRRLRGKKRVEIVVWAEAEEASPQRPTAGSTRKAARSAY